MPTATKTKVDAKEFMNFLLSVREGCDNPVLFEGDIQIQLLQGVKIPLHDINGLVFVCKKAIPKGEHEEEEEEEDDTENIHLNESAHQTTERSQPLTVLKARQLLSWYVISQNPSMSQESTPALPPMWVYCDMSDSEGTSWLGAETICSGSKVAAVKFHSVACKGPVVGKASFTTLQALKETHKRRHHQSAMVTRGFAKYNLFGSTVVENTVIESQTTMSIDLRWDNVESILQTPPLFSTATLNVKVTSGDTRSPMYQLYKELEFVQILANGLRTGGTEWLEPLDLVSAVDLTKALIEDLQNRTKTVQTQSLQGCKEKIKTESASSVEGPMLNMLLTERGDLDFMEQLWLKMRMSVTSYQDIVDCLTLVINALKYGDIKPWIHRDSTSSLSKLVLQSYTREMEPVSLTGLTPVRMLLEMGLDKMRKDYINYLIGQELTTLNHLSYYLDTKVDLQEQVERLKKLHHLLEIVVTCSTFLSMPYDHLFVLTQSCLQYYATCPYDEDHDFQLQIRPAVIRNFYEKEHPLTWGIEVSSGHGPREVRTTWQLSDKSPVDHLTYHASDIALETTVNGECEDPPYFITTAYCSLVNFS